MISLGRANYNGFPNSFLSFFPWKKTNEKGHICYIYIYIKKKEKRKKKKEHIYNSKKEKKKRKKEQNHKQDSTETLVAQECD